VADAASSMLRNAMHDEGATTTTATATTATAAAATLSLNKVVRRGSACTATAATTLNGARYGESVIGAERSGPDHTAATPPPPPRPPPPPWGGP